MAWWIVVVVIVLLGAGISWVWYTRLRTMTPAAVGDAERPDRLPAALADFHVRGPEALVYLEVPLPDGDVDPVLRDLMLREALEVVRDKSHHLPITEVHRVVAFGRRDQEWHRVGELGLDVPGELPPPLPHPLPREAPDGFDPLERPDDLPDAAPGLASERGHTGLMPWQDEIRIPAALDARLRTQGLDPAAAELGEAVLAMMRLAGYTLTPGKKAPNTWTALRAGRRAYIETVPHAPGDYPELDDEVVRRFCVDFVQSSADQGLLVTEKYSPFEIYERERRDHRLRFVTRERLQHFVDALSVG